MAVIDGSTSKTTHRIHPQMCNGRYCMTLVAEFIHNVNPNISCEKFCNEIAEYIKGEYLKRELSLRELAEKSAERLTASAVIYTKARQEIWMIGDCQCRMGGKNYENQKPEEEVIAAKRASFIAQKLKQGLTAADFQTTDASRDFILPDLLQSCKRQNKDYAVIDGFDIPMNKVRVLPAAAEVVLATDGYPFLCDTLQESEEKLQEVLAKDPLCAGIFKATKGLMAGNNSFDDRSYVRFRT